MFLTHSTSRSNSVVWRLIQSCHVFFCAARDDRRLVVESLLCVSAVVPFSVILRVDAHSAMAQGVSLAVIHTTRCLVVFGVFLLYSLFGHVSRIWGLIGEAVDSPVYEPLVGAMDTSGPGEVLCFVGLSGDQY